MRTTRRSRRHARAFARRRHSNERDDPVTGGALALGTWQALYLAEHRTSGHTRKLVVHVHGD
jgi:thiamine phosphate synthase YjbQ (UPF0047 family)